MKTSSAPVERRPSSSEAGSASSAKSALGGQSAVQLVYGDGTGSCSARKSCGRKKTTSTSGRGARRAGGRIASGQPPVGEREGGVDEEHLDRPPGRPAERVPAAAVRLGERGEEPRQPEQHEDRAEAGGPARVPGVEADGERGADDQRAPEPDLARVRPGARGRDAAGERREQARRGIPDRGGDPPTGRPAHVDQRWRHGAHVTTLTVAAARAPPPRPADGRGSGGSRAQRPVPGRAGRA